jgi:hypothetical protein
MRGRSPKTKGDEMKLRKLVLKLLFVLLIVGLLVLVGRLMYSRLSVQAARQDRSIPYTVILRETVHQPNGTTTVAMEVTWAIRSDGSTVRRFVHKSDRADSQRTVQFSTGLEVAINELTNSKTSMMKKSLLPASGWQRDPSSRCINSLAGKPMTSTTETFVSEETVAGYRTAKVVSDVITAWYALDYGCALVKDRWGFETGEVSEKELVALTGGEPNPALFEVPANAAEVPPSERLLGPTKECKGCDGHGLEVLRKLDEEYKRLAVKP